MKPNSNDIQREFATTQMAELQAKALDSTKPAASNSDFCFFDHLILRALETEKNLLATIVPSADFAPAH